MTNSRTSTVKKVSGLGWSGVYCDGDLGWLVSEFVTKYPSTLDEGQRQALGLAENKRGVAASDMYRVRITVEPIKNKRGRYIVKRTKRPKYE